MKKNNLNSKTLKSVDTYYKDNTRDVLHEALDDILVSLEKNVREQFYNNYSRGLEL